MLKEINRSIELHKDLWLDELARLVRAKSISGTGEGVDQCAELFAQLLNEAGVDAKVMRLDGCETEPPFPFVVGTLRAEDENAPTFLIYGHYDVKPAGDLALWKTNLSGISKADM